MPVMAVRMAGKVLNELFASDTWCSQDNPERLVGNVEIWLWSRMSCSRSVTSDIVLGMPLTVPLVISMIVI